MSWKPALGAIYSPKGTHFRVWAPERQHMDVVFENLSSYRLKRTSGGYFEGVHRAPLGTRYRYRLDGKDMFADPCSRFQPEGPHGPSVIVDSHAFRWSDAAWKGIRMNGQVFYELHVGTFTREGTFDAALQKLPYLKSLGITTVEIMPVHDWAGRWNWGYDGVSMFAPARAYGDYEALKRFVNRAHQLGMGVILDVVYNHMGPDGCYLSCYSKNYFTRQYRTDWGDALNYHYEGSAGVRRFFIENACYWIAEFHLDGLRLDATQNIYDDSTPHVLAELSQQTRRAAGSRSIVLVAENESQDVRCLTPVSQGGFGLDGVWSDDFHHAARVAMTGKNEAYYSDFHGTPQEVLSAVKRGYLYQGQTSKWQKLPRGTPTRRPRASSFVFYTQNHDQVANGLKGERLASLIPAGRLRAMTALHLLAPETPLLFMGQEYGVRTPFTFFVDHKEELKEPIRKGRRAFLAQFPSNRTPQAQRQVPDPTDPKTFYRSKLSPPKTPAEKAVLRLHRDLLALRRKDPVLSRADFGTLDGAVLSDQALLIRFFGEKGNDRLLLINWGPAFSLFPCPEPLIAPPEGRHWTLAWDSNKKPYGGSGLKPNALEKGGLFPAQSALFYGIARHAS